MEAVELWSQTLLMIQGQAQSSCENIKQMLSTKPFTTKYSSCSTIYLDDSTVSQPHFTTTIKSNELERQFLQLIVYNVKVSGSVYAKYYFDLRSLAKDNSLHLPVYLLNKERAQNLQAVSRVEDTKIFHSATMRRSFSADNFITLQRPKAIIS
ncbi:PREDICTED: cyclin-Y-like protein 2 [Mandrillus leucophaeus]|uniref:cyclin-Y-like protein 2 n=1 Tax=Mandrillus leucophaeus TaxID=9568 RepID=UPI0005F36387|nr:PREDICTED: cyclin-Y-like protein 2 [Mandrillus leucophaeus]